MEEFEAKYENAQAEVEKLNLLLNEANLALKKEKEKKPAFDDSESVKKQLEEANKKLENAERLKEVKVTENFNLKELIDRTKVESEKQKKRAVVLEDKCD